MSLFDSCASSYPKCYTDTGTLSNLYFNRRKQVVTQVVSELSPKTIVDLGCGTGHISSSLATLPLTAHITLVDASNNMLQLAREAMANYSSLSYQLLHHDLSEDLHLERHDLLIAIGLLAYIHDLNCVTSCQDLNVLDADCHFVLQVSDPFHPLKQLYSILALLRPRKAQANPLDLLQLSRWRLQDLDSHFYRLGFTRVLLRRFCFDVPGFMSLKVSSMFGKLLNSLDHIIGTDFLIIYKKSAL